MAEVATNVLHNVGNILNSVNISASLVAERVKQSKSAGRRRVVAALLRRTRRRSGRSSSPPMSAASTLPEYLAQLGRAAAERPADGPRGTRVAARQPRAHQGDGGDAAELRQALRASPKLSPSPMLVEDSLRLNAGAFVRHGVTVYREFGEVPPITVDKHKVLQILVNLVRNAKYACDESGQAGKLHHPAHRSRRAGVRICVIDNGVGIHPENMGRLFTHGFTTRSPGTDSDCTAERSPPRNSAARSRRESDGPGRGATFILELPSAPRSRPCVIRVGLSRRILVIDDNAAIHRGFPQGPWAPAEQSAQAMLDVLEAASIRRGHRVGGAPGFRDRFAHAGTGRRRDGAPSARERGARTHGVRRHADAARAGMVWRPSSSCGRWTRMCRS